LRYFIHLGECFTQGSGKFEDCDEEEVDVGTGRKRKGKEDDRVAAASVRTNTKRRKLVEGSFSYDVNFILPGLQSRRETEALVRDGEDVIDVEVTNDPIQSSSSSLVANGESQAIETYRPRRDGESVLSERFVI